MWFSFYFVNSAVRHFVESQIWLNKMAGQRSSRSIRKTIRLWGLFVWIIILYFLNLQFPDIHVITNVFCSPKLPIWRQTCPFHKRILELTSVILSTLRSNKNILWRWLDNSPTTRIRTESNKELKSQKKPAVQCSLTKAGYTFGNDSKN